MQWPVRHQLRPGNAIAADSAAALGQVATLLKANEDLKLRVEAHTDTRAKAPTPPRSRCSALC